MTSLCNHCGAQNHPGRLACYACDYPLGRSVDLPLDSGDGERGHEFFALDLPAPPLTLGRAQVDAAALPGATPAPASPRGWWARLAQALRELLWG